MVVCSLFAQGSIVDWLMPSWMENSLAGLVVRLWPRCQLDPFGDLALCWANRPGPQPTFLGFAKAC